MRRQLGDGGARRGEIDRDPRSAHRLHEARHARARHRRVFALLQLTRNVAFARAVAYHDHAEDPIATAVGTFMLGANRAQPAILNTAS
jgi:hypothetical protein